ncbi:MAG: phosphoglycerate kinase [Bacteriovoracaceae bacterium]|jgi:phosphoglycerate kinase|nr:phosphoglycerate kinase [Bacteriovoracaceae bacterium]
MAIKYIDTANFEGKKVLARFDFNVPLKDGNITDTSRIDKALPTIKHILESGASKLTMMSHLGRPKSNEDTQFSLEPVAKYIAEKLDFNVVLAPASVDAGVKELLTLNETKIVLLENLRFHKEEKANEMEFASKLSHYADVYVNDAFGVSHRKHASVHEINRFFASNAYAGFLIKSELEALDKVLNKPQKPFVGIIGGAKVSDKIATIEKLLTSVDHLLIGGAMAYPFLKSKGVEVGNSLCSDEDVKLATNILKADKVGKIKLPVDHIVSNSLDGDANTCDDVKIDEGMIGLDIGAKSIANYCEIISTAKTVLWNGPMGMFENESFSNGTMSIAKALSESSAFTVVGGGDSVSAMNKSGHADKVSHISTGGGASLEYIEKGELPGIQALKFGVN